MKMIRGILKSWLPLAVAVTLLSGMVYLAVQQSLRIGANNPQIQMAEDAARSLAAGQSADTLIPDGKVDIAQSLAPYIVVFDASGKPVASNAELHNQAPSLPDGVLAYVRQHGEDRISYQPEPGVRSAVVVAPVAGGLGFVMVGRSLREVEKLIDTTSGLVVAIWLVTLLATLAVVAVFEFLHI